MEQIGQILIFEAFYTEDGEGKTGLAGGELPTVDVWEVQPDGTKAEVVTAGNSSPVGDGLYHYNVAGGTVDARAAYSAVFKTTNADVDQKHLAAALYVGSPWVERVDTDLSDLATAAALATAQADLDAPDQYRADVSAMALEANVQGHAAAALTAYDPPTDAEMDAAFLAQTGADGDTLKTLSDQLDGVATLGPGATAFTYTLTSSVDGTPIAQADVWATTDAGGGNVIARGTTDDSGDVTFYLDAGTYYVWRAKSGYEFENPDTEVIT